MTGVCGMTNSRVPGNAAGMAKLGIFGEIASDTIEDSFDDALRGVRVIPCDVLA
jgi:hypothetical protein